MIEDYCLDRNLQKIRVVLVETSHPGNIGAIARAMKNMGLSDLVLVNPKEYPSQVASARASSASDILDRAKVVSSLDDALVGCKLAFGASARLRKVSWPQLDVRETAELAIKTVSEEDAQVALVFGREDSGLSNAEMDKCNYLSHIPSNPTYSSLNISQAVQVFSYECLMATNVKSVHQKEGYRHKLASSDQLEGFYDHLYQSLQDVGFLDPNKNARFMRRMRRLFNRAQLDVKEVDILRCIMRATQRKLGGSEKDE